MTRLPSCKGCIWHAYSRQQHMHGVQTRGQIAGPSCCPTSFIASPVYCHSMMRNATSEKMSSALRYW